MDSRRRARPSSKYSMQDVGLGGEAAYAGGESAVADLVKALRIQAGLSQRQLATKIGTTASVICRLENQRYRGHSLDMLRRIGESFGMKVVVSFEPTTTAVLPKTHLNNVECESKRS